MKRFAINICVFAFMVITAQIILMAVFPAHSSGKEIAQLEEYLAQTADIVYFGDSTIASVREDDSNKENIAAMLQELLQDYQVGRLDHPAYNFDVYLAYATFIAHQPQKPKLVIMPINMRSFSPEWDMRPAYQFSQEKRHLYNNNTLFYRTVSRPLSVFHYYESDITLADYQQTVVYSGTVPMGQVMDFENKAYDNYSEENMRRKLIFFYMYQLTPEHRKVQSMLETAAMFQQHQIEFIFYITPIDVETGTAFLGPIFQQRIIDNTQLIENLLYKEGAEILNLADDLDASYFAWQTYPNEHLNEDGRLFIAQQLAQTIEQQGLLIP